MDKSKEKEKLMDLIVDAKRADPETGSFSEWLAAFLLDHGVMVPADDGPGADRLRELIQADREEKCLILPCKVGDTVYKFDASICKYRDKDKCDEYCDGFQYRDCWEGSQIVAATNFELKMLWSFGKTVFPTREEAEAALAKMREEGRE